MVHLPLSGTSSKPMPSPSTPCRCVRTHTNSPTPPPISVAPLLSLSVYSTRALLPNEHLIFPVNYIARPLFRHHLQQKLPTIYRHCNFLFWIQTTPSFLFPFPFFLFYFRPYATVYPFPFSAPCTYNGWAGSPLSCRTRTPFRFVSLSQANAFIRMLFPVNANPVLLLLCTRYPLFFFNSETKCNHKNTCDTPKQTPTHRVACISPPPSRVPNQTLSRLDQGRSTTLPEKTRCIPSRRSSPVGFACHRTKSYFYCISSFSSQNPSQSEYIFVAPSQILTFLPQSLICKSHNLFSSSSSLYYHYQKLPSTTTTQRLTPLRIHDFKNLFHSTSFNQKEMTLFSFPPPHVDPIRGSLQALQRHKFSFCARQYTQSKRQSHKSKRNLPWRLHSNTNIPPFSFFALFVLFCLNQNSPPPPSPSLPTDRPKRKKKRDVKGSSTLAFFPKKC